MTAAGRTSSSSRRPGQAPTRPSLLRASCRAGAPRSPLPAAQAFAPEPIWPALMPEALGQLAQRLVGRPQRALERDDPRVEEVTLVVLAPLVVVKALDPAAVLLGDLVGVRRPLPLPRSARLERHLPALQAERVDAARLRDPDLALLGDALQHEGGAGGAAGVGVRVVVEAPRLRVVAAAGVLEEQSDPLLHALLVARAHRAALVAYALVEQVGTADAAVAAAPLERGPVERRRLLQRARLGGAGRLRGAVGLVPEVELLDERELLAEELEGLRVGLGARDRARPRGAAAVAGGVEGDERLQLGLLDGVHPLLDPPVVVDDRVPRHDQARAPDVQLLEVGVAERGRVLVTDAGDEGCVSC